MRGIEKSFPGVRALKGIDLDLNSGEALALLGENGAGKSTLIKILGGAHPPDAGAIEIDGEAVSIVNPTDAQKAGIGVIYQEFNLVPALTVRENMFLGQEGGVFSLTHARQERRQTREVLERIGVPIDTERLCRELTVGQQQAVEIAKALLLDARIIVMDEPSAALTLKEVDGLFNVVRELKAQRVGIIYISHRLDEIFEIADRVMVMRDGEHVGTEPIGDLTRNRLIEMMVGRKLDDEFPKKAAEIGEERLVVRGLNRSRVVRDVSFSVRRGEVLGLTGLVGAGRTETARLIFGADERDSGTIELDGKPLDIRHPRQAIAAGICLLTEDRKAEGLVLGQSVRENFGLPNLKSFSERGFISDRRESQAFAKHVESLQIKIADQEQITGTLSGGNQQKVVLAKWLERDAEVIIFDEPTRGIDVGAKFEIYLLMNQLVAAGKAIVMISSELPEVLGMSDRILVMHEGRVTGEVTDVASVTQEQIMQLAVGLASTV
ncbi:MAG: D-xylose ABC transporter ATP-binding protein [Planctomycetaceae bacterium]|nr:D-xylose ABC transporter ATP-binding protein [Planctomycetaceae bacterium]